MREVESIIRNPYENATADGAPAPRLGCKQSERRDVAGGARLAVPRATQEHGQLALSAGDSKVFGEALLSLPPVADRLRDTVRRYRERTGVR